LNASPDQAVPLLRERLHPTLPPDPRRLASLLANLASDHFEDRRQAESELGGLGERTEPFLRKALADNPPPDLRQRLARLLDKFAVPTGDQVRDLRAVELLEQIGNAEARQVLRIAAGGMPGTRLTRGAASAVQRLSKQAVRP
jgi:hypothetical protein